MIDHLPRAHPLQRLDGEIRRRFVAAQGEALDDEFDSAGGLLRKVAEDVKLKLKIPRSLFSKPLDHLLGRSHDALEEVMTSVLRASDVGESALPSACEALVQQIQLVRAFAAPDLAVAKVREKVAEVVADFPREAKHIECGKNPGDVLDPFILAATQFLMYADDFERAIGAIVAHKALMKIEGLLGHLHEDVLGEMRGNVRVVEPRGEDKETRSVPGNPFPGADLVQPPLANREISFHQIKSKTGSAKGGDGKRLGDQLGELRDTYGGSIYYHALIGNTLKGHRSRGAVEKAAPGVVVLVGRASFRQLTGTDCGPQLLLNVYQSAFRGIARETGYDVDTMAAGIVESFRVRAKETGEGYLGGLLEEVIGGDASEQDNRLYVGGRKKRG